MLKNWLTRLPWKKNELWIISAGVIGIISFILLKLLATPGNMAKIYNGQELITTLYLNKDTSLSIDALTVTVKDGKAAITQSDCPDQICVKTGWLTDTGDSAACLPNEIILLIGEYSET